MPKHIHEISVLDSTLQRQAKALFGPGDVPLKDVEVRSQIKEMLEKRLFGHHRAIVWPAKSKDIPDEEPRFLVADLPLEFAADLPAATRAAQAGGPSEKERKALEYLTKYRDRPRRFRNGLGLAIPEKKQIEALGRTVRYLLAIDRDEVDSDSGFLMMPAALPEAPTAQPADAFPVDTDAVPPPSLQEGPAGVGVGMGTGPVTMGTGAAGRKKRVAFAFEATREQVYKAFPAIANPADKSDGARVRIRIEGSSATGFDPSWLRNVVDEPLDEADIERTEEVRYDHGKRRTNLST